MSNHPLRILHCHSTFALGGKEARAVRLMNALGDAASHTILSATSDLAARDAIDPGIAVAFPAGAPSLTGKPGPGRYRDLARYMRQFDLVLTYNWGAMDAVGARRLFPGGLPPLIHHEDGFNADEADRLNWKRNAFRRLMLPTAAAVVVPSHRLESIARAIWHQGDRVRRIANGIATARYAIPPAPDAIPGFARRTGDVVIGTIAGLRPVKDIPRLVRLFASLPDQCRLVIVGTGPEEARIRQTALELGVAGRVHLPGFLPEPWRYVGLFDIMALTSLSEQQPIAVIEAMAAGLPVVAPDVGDIRQMVTRENGFIGDDVVMRDAFARLVADPALRASVGAANQRHATATCDEEQMISAYRTLYWETAKKHRQSPADAP